MAFLRMAFFPDGSDHHWRRVVAAVGDRLPPEGRFAFAAGPVEGGWQVVQLWNSLQDLDDFNRDVFLPAMRQLGSDGFPKPPVVTDVHPVDAWIGQRCLK